MGILSIAPLNPLRFVLPEGGRFDGLYGVEQANAFQRTKCYFQKWQTNDTTTVQVLSDFEFTFKIIHAATGVEALEIVPTELNTDIVGQTFKVHEVALDFSELLEAEYFARIEYQNDESETVVIESEIFEVAEEWPGTLLFRYKNSENNFSVVFDTGIEYNIRIEAVLADFNPESDDIVYNDQKRNPSLLDSIPYRSFSLYAGGLEGLPPWMADKLNRVMACDIVSIDGDYYEKKEGASWEVTRAQEYQFVGMTLEIVPIENRFLERLKTGSGGTGQEGGNGVQKAEKFTDISGALAIAGKFRANSLLEKICVVRTGLAFEMNVGTSNGGSQIGNFTIDGLVTTVTVNHLFTDVATVYLSGITEASLIWLIWKQLDETNTGGGSPSTSLPLGTTLIYDPLDEDDLTANFDLVTGLGKEDGDWWGWAIADGRNGTKDRGGVFPLGYQPGEYELGATGGAKEQILTEDNIPEHEHFTVGANQSTAGLTPSRSIAQSNQGSGVYNYGLAGSDFDPTVGRTSAFGAEEPEAVATMPPYLVSLWITKIAE